MKLIKIESGIINYSKRAVMLFKNKLRIREFTSDDKNSTELKNRIEGLCVILGIKKKLSDEEILAMYELIVARFGDFGIDEISEAIQMAVANELKIDGEPYQSLSSVYLGRVLSAYREYRRKELRKARLAEQAAEREAEDKAEESRQPTTKKDKQKLAYDCIIEDIKKHKKLPMGACWEEAYLYLEGKGKIKLTNEEKDVFVENVKASLLETEDRELAKRILSRPVLFKRECRTQYLKQYLESNLKNIIE